MSPVETKSPPYVVRQVRVNVPVLISFSADTYTVREFSLNLSEGGMFVTTEKMCPVGTEGTLRFRASQYDEPIVVQAKVVRTVEPGTEANGQTCGLGIQFQDASEEQLGQLREIVEGVRSGTVVDTIRKSILESGRTLSQELRCRPTDQKMMLAMTAHGTELDALIRDGTPSVILRLLECPRITPAHIMMILRNPQLPTRVLSAIKSKGKWLANQEIRFLFVTHQNAMLPEAMEQLRMMPPDRMHRVAANGGVRRQLRVRAQELTRAPGLKPKFGRR